MHTILYPRATSKYSQKTNRKITGSIGAEPMQTEIIGRANGTVTRQEGPSSGIGHAIAVRFAAEVRISQSMFRNEDVKEAAAYIGRSEQAVQHMHVRPGLKAVRSMLNSDADRFAPSIRQPVYAVLQNCRAQIGGFSMPKERPEAGFDDQFPDLLRRRLDVMFGVFE